LYEGAIRFLQKAGEALGRSDRAEMSEQLLKAQKIVHFLATSLDFEQGGPVAQNLSRLYAYLRDTLNEANLHATPAKIEEAVSLLRPLLDAWRVVAHDPVAAAALEARAAAPRPVRAAVFAPEIGARPATAGAASPLDDFVPAAPAESSNPALASAYKMREAAIEHPVTGALSTAPAGAYPGRPRAVAVPAAEDAESDAPAQETTPADKQRAADRKAAGRAAYGLRVLA
jgi:flagellar protein FliS